MQLNTISAKVRLIAEILMEIAAVLYIIAALREARFLGLNMFIENLVRMILSSVCLFLSFLRLLLSEKKIFYDTSTIFSSPKYLTSEYLKKRKKERKKEETKERKKKDKHTNFIIHIIN